VDLVVLHYTGMETAAAALQRLTDPAPVAARYPGPWQDPDVPPTQPLGRVSAHYLVEEDGLIWRLVPEEARAWHAGAGVWRGREALNDRSIGVEIVNGGHDFGLPAYPDAQIAAVIDLVRDILLRHGLSPWSVVGHSDVAPARKADPGERFPWRRLAVAGCAVWPEPAVGVEAAPLAVGDMGPNVLQMQSQLSEIGYGLTISGRYDAQTQACVTAFQRRFRAGQVDGQADSETLALLASLHRQREAERA